MSEDEKDKMVGIIIRTMGTFESWLRKLGAEGNGIIKLMDSIKDKIPPKIREKIKKCNYVRNQVAHGSSISLEQFEFFQRNALKIAHYISSLERGEVIIQQSIPNPAIFSLTRIGTLTCSGYTSSQSYSEQVVEEYDEDSDIYYVYSSDPYKKYNYDPKEIPKDAATTKMERSILEDFKEWSMAAKIAVGAVAALGIGALIYAFFDD